MALVQRLELRQGQQLVMTPQLQQAIRLLQLSNIELCSFVEEEVERNPLLESEQVAPDPGPEMQATQRKDDEDGEEAGADGGGDWSDGETPFPLNGARQDTGEAAHLNGATADSGWASVRQRTSNAFGGEESNLEDFVAVGRSLADHLTEQLHVVVTDPAERLIGAYLVHMVDEAGYLRGDLEDLAAKLGAPLSLIDRVLETLQGFDPPGVLARDLAECLALQLKDQNRYDPQIAKLLDNLGLLGSHNLAALKRAVGVDAQELAEMIAEIKGLNPKPGLQVRHRADPAGAARRDGAPGARRQLGGGAQQRHAAARAGQPQLLCHRLQDARSSAKDRDYLVDCLQNANWLVKSLDQRARTILRVAEEIVRQQDGFLTYGIAALEAAQPEDGGRCHLDARVDRQPRHLQQVHGDAARRVRAQVLLHLGDRLRRWRGGALLRGGAPPHPPADRCRDGRRGAVRRQDRRAAQARRGRHRQAHRGEIPRGAAHPLLGAAPPREADGGAAAGKRVRAAASEPRFVVCRFQLAVPRRTKTGLRFARLTVDGR